MPQPPNLQKMLAEAQAMLAAQQEAQEALKSEKVDVLLNCREIFVFRQIKEVSPCSSAGEHQHRHRGQHLGHSQR